MKIRKPGLKLAKSIVLEALQSGSFECEARSVIEEKNLLAVGDLEIVDAISLVARTTGEQYRAEVHHSMRETWVCIFQPIAKEIRWYIKAYWLELDQQKIVFISFHPSENPYADTTGR